jgi:hypothetical protein
VTEIVQVSCVPWRELNGKTKRFDGNSIVAHNGHCKPKNAPRSVGRVLNANRPSQTGGAKRLCADEQLG